MKSGPGSQDYVPFLTVMSTEFEKDLDILKRILRDFEERVHADNGFRLSDSAEMAAGWWFYDVLASREVLQKLFGMLFPQGTGKDKKSLTLRIVGAFQEQLIKSGSEARVKMYGDIPFAAPWWAWLMR